MIPLSLKIKGLYSYQKEQVIDFQRLLEGQIFGIFGAVGSGKSSILEAVTFALYGETDRLHKKENRAYNMMNLKSNEVLIDLIFRNYDGVEYRFIVRGKRNRNKFDTVSSYKRSAYTKTNGTWYPLEDNDATDILGLSYQNFKRTIIIPQGKFQEFLQLGSADRTTMLKEIFHLDKYEYYGLTTAIEDENKGRIHDIEGQLKMFVDITKNLINNKVKIIETLENDLATRESELQDKEQQEKDESNIKRIFEDLDAKKAELSDLKEQENGFSSREKEVESYEYCMNTFKAKLDRAEELGEQKEAEEHSIKQSKRELTRVTGNYDSVDKEFKNISEEYNNLDKKKSEITDYERIIRILNKDAALTKLKDDYKKNSQKLEKADEERKRLGNQIKTINTEIKKKRDALPDISHLSEIKEWYDKRSIIETNMRDVRGEIRKSENEIKAIKKEIVNAIPKLIQSYIEVSSDLDANITMIRKFRTRNKKDQQLLQEELNHFALQAELANYVQSLVPGKPCPLCGALEHPDILDVEDVSEHIKISEKKKEKHEEIDEMCQKTLDELSAMKNEISSLKKALGKDNKNIQRLAGELDKHLNTFIWQEYDPEDNKRIKKELSDIKPQQQRIEKLENELTETETKYQSESEKYEELKDHISEIKTAIKSDESVKESHINQLEVLCYETGQYIKDEVQQHIRQCGKEIKRIDEGFKIISKKREELTIEISKLKERIGNYEKASAGTRNKLNKSEKEITDLLKDSPYHTVNEVKQILEYDLDVNNIRKDIESYRQKLYKANEDVKQLKKKTKGKKFDPDAYRKLLDDIIRVKGEIKDIREKLGGEKSDLIKLQQDIKKKAKLEKELGKLEIRAENITVLKNLFRANGFVNFVSSVYLQNLCNAANERFNQLTRQQLRLEINEKNDFEVRDFLNDGKHRSVKTLSGGQIFQASLSLALALAESVQQQRENQQNFFFLDEGFGSLDREALQVVFDTLKSLRKENRIVGIISHVDELQQEIDMYVRVTNDDEKGSSIKNSWA
jgi:DNA repair protein SbcC/Rad50